ncbi:MAG: hypothetical protein M0R51_12170 [Clostridia bacterium]|jgi:hypothetical protein|nr:hypothetical protein [Clostridia bacterium]
MAEKVYMDETMKVYSFMECPDAVITDMLKDDLITVELELYKVVYRELATVYIVSRKEQDCGETFEYKTKKSALKKYTALLEAELMARAEWDAEEWNNFREAAKQDYQKWEKC